MLPSIRALLTGIIDYAGLFPPAQLPLEQAIRQYARYRSTPEARMLGRFICPAARLVNLAPFAEELFTQRAPFVFSALGRGGKNGEEFQAGLWADLEAISLFRQQHGDCIRVDALEGRLPAGVKNPERVRRARELVLQAADHIDFMGPKCLTPFWEIGLGLEWQCDIEQVVNHLHHATESNAHLDRARCGPFGFKLRCGGVEASAFPTPEQVAFTIVTCRDIGVPLKFTAGLHHPLRHFDRGLQVTMHGFLNLFAAGVLAYARLFNFEEVLAIILDEDPSHFRFDARGMSWKDARASVDEITAARRELVTSFGSCSFDEPREDLRALGWL